MDQSSLKEKINQVLLQEFELEPGDMVSEALLYEDLGLDSLDAVDMVVSFEKAFAINIGKNTELVSIKTLGELQEFIIRIIAAQHG
ncbi:phosphopantetheine-binding protein [Erwinia sorbitola]|uniref:Acyl carrier protein n=1 Tax=Erwinia sorbitola TaxID=2681984 RepID=A0A6I6ETS4_9GAMM|nr:phosphopantetheine-binding protein [Erwinia sorbitola]MTD26913.1 acyl carrier protein [Erwinia sorbitola]QGU88479.1 acyl carrier protein [Erwinia sorbitola]